MNDGLAQQTKIGLIDLSDEAGWISLIEFIQPNLANAALSNIFEQLKGLGAGSALLETEYLDRDYSAEYSAFYSRLYLRHSRPCRRLHFFRGDVFNGLASDAASLATALKGASDNGDYLGFLVIRPIPDAPIGRAVIAPPVAPSGCSTRLMVRARYEVHLLGVTLTIQSMPFTQQDTRISACAQASIWMTGRHFHTKHGGPWYSTVAITEAASQPTDITLAASLPAGSNGLNVNNMLRAIRAMDRHPYAFYAEQYTSTGAPIWGRELDPVAILSRYVGSGLPVIVGLLPWRVGQRDGHAIVAVGETFKPLDPAVLSVSRPHAGLLASHFLVNDDQGGPARRMGIERSTLNRETDYNVREHVQFLIVPLPDKVFVPGEIAEVRAWDFFDHHGREWSGLKAVHATKIGGSVTLGDEIIEAARQNRVLVKTYLTLGSRYKQRIFESGAATTLREKIAFFNFPRMVWVSEFARLDDVNTLDAGARRIFGHCVVDATSTGPDQPPLIFHAPGFLYTFPANSPDFYPVIEPEIFPILDDRVYRGHSKPEIGAPAT